MMKNRQFLFLLLCLLAMPLNAQKLSRELHSDEQTRRVLALTGWERSKEAASDILSCSFALKGVKDVDERVILFIEDIQSPLSLYLNGVQILDAIAPVQKLGLDVSGFLQENGEIKNTLLLKTELLPEAISSFREMIGEENTSSAPPKMVLEVCSNPYLALPGEYVVALNENADLDKSLYQLDTDDGMLCIKVPIVCDMNEEARRILHVDLYGADGAVLASGDLKIRLNPESVSVPHLILIPLDKTLSPEDIMERGDHARVALRQGRKEVDAVWVSY